MTRAEIMCADSSLLLRKHYSICVTANLFVVPQRSSSAAVHCAATAYRERRQANYTTAGMNETEKVQRRGGGSVVKQKKKKLAICAQALNLCLHMAPHKNSIQLHSNSHNNKQQEYL